MKPVKRSFLVCCIAVLDQGDYVRQSTVVQWIYNFGPRRFIRTITFVGGRVSDIEEGDYGY